MAVNIIQNPCEFFHFCRCFQDKCYSDSGRLCSAESEALQPDILCGVVRRIEGEPPVPLPVGRTQRSGHFARREESA